MSKIKTFADPTVLCNDNFGKFRGRVRYRCNRENIVAPKQEPTMSFSLFQVKRVEMINASKEETRQSNRSDGVIGKK